MSTVNRRSFLTAAGLVGMAGAFGVAGCSQVTGKAPTGGGGGGGAAAGHSTSNGILTIGAGTDTSNQFPHNFNVFGGGNSAPGTGFFYECLFRIGQTNGGALIPHLAESKEFNSDGTIETYHLRKGVTWSDGTPFTAADVAFTYDFVYGPPGKKGSDAFLYKPMEVVDDHTVRAYYATPELTEDFALASWYPIYPKHIYEKVGDHSKYVDKNPVGTGPGKLKSFESGRIEIELREDYWGGKSDVKSVVIVPQGTVGNVQSQITQGKVDWSDGGGQGVLTTFLKASENNKYAFWVDGSTTGVQFNCTKEPTNDKFVRQALRDAIDYDAIQKAMGTGYPVPTITGMDHDLYQGWILPQYDKQLTQNVAAAKQALSAGGWTVKGGNLTKGGKSYPLSIMVNLGSPDHVLVVPMMIAQWKAALGLEVKQIGKADQVFKTDKIAHKFQMSFWNTNLGGSPVNCFMAYSWQNLGKKEQEADYGNPGLWKAPKSANDALVTMGKTDPSDTETMKRLNQTVQKAVAEDAPYAPVLAGGSGEMMSTKNWTGWPEPGQSDYRPTATSFYNNMVLTVLKLKPAAGN